MLKNIQILFCPVWNYKPRAASLAASIKNATGIEPVITAGLEGLFDIVVDGKTIFSKDKEGRFPFEEEIIKHLH